MIEIKFDDDSFPESLRIIKKPPKKLYAIGNIELLKKSSIAVIGTRNITEYGEKYCKKIVSQLVRRDIPIISGMAIGTDTVAHKTALENGGETIAVLGGGLNEVYPRCNVNLFNKIIENNGLVISEYEPDVTVSSKRFLERNRIVSGLSLGVLVIEAAYRSGTSVTANIAKSQGKVVMALPGRLDEIHGVGVNRLIQNGAKLVTNVDDVLIHFPQFIDKMWIKDNENVEKQISLFDIKDEYREIANILKNGEKLSLDEISKKIANKSIIQIMEILVEMEIDDVIKKEISGKYMLNI